MREMAPRLDPKSVPSAGKAGFYPNAAPMSFPMAPIPPPRVVGKVGRLPTILSAVGLAKVEALATVEVRPWRAGVRQGLGKGREFSHAKAAKVAKPKQIPPGRTTLSG